MTRGRFVLIDDKRAYESLEFNGDMYFYGWGYGYDAMEAIRNVRSRQEFEIAVAKFNDEHHKYDVIDNDVIRYLEELHDNVLDVENIRSLKLTDYTFYKNISDNEIVLLCEDDKEVHLKPHCSVALCFGRADSDSIPEKYRHNYPETIQTDDIRKKDTAEHNDKSDGYRRLFIMRKDLNMSPGKLASQIAHCAEAYWMNIMRSWEIGQVYNGKDTREGDYMFSGNIDKGIYEGYVKGIFTKTVCEARNLHHLLWAKEKALRMGMQEGVDFGLINDMCLTELEPENEDGSTTTGIWFRPLQDSTAHEISRKYQLYK